MQDNLIYRIKDFWGNLHAADLESGASSESLHKQDLMISESRDSEISWLTVMWSESWQSSSWKKYSEIDLKQQQWEQNMWLTEKSSNYINL